MEYQAPDSKCLLCSSEFSKKGMTRHIGGCLRKHLEKDEKNPLRRWFFIKVSDAYNNDYFLHLLISGEARLENLDLFLRGIWLECCGHLSAFSLQPYAGEIKKNQQVRRVFSPGLKLSYQYDFGSTTELQIDVLDTFQGKTKTSEPIQLLARNAAPIIPCSECENHPAVQICTECLWDEGGWLCSKCAKTHPCDEDMRLPVVNSPRTGVCGYSG